jgi:hypothetical protein
MVIYRVRDYPTRGTPDEPALQAGRLRSSLCVDRGDAAGQIRRGFCDTYWQDISLYQIRAASCGFIIKEGKYHAHL